MLISLLPFPHTHLLQYIKKPQWKCDSGLQATLIPAPSLIMLREHHQDCVFPFSGGQTPFTPPRPISFCFKQNSYHITVFQQCKFQFASVVHQKLRARSENVNWTQKQNQLAKQRVRVHIWLLTRGFTHAPRSHLVNALQECLFHPLSK